MAADASECLSTCTACWSCRLGPCSSGASMTLGRGLAPVVPCDGPIATLVLSRWKYCASIYVLCCTMKAAAILCRQCLRQSNPFVSRLSARTFTSSRWSFARRTFSAPKFPGRRILWSGAAGATLSPLALIAIGNNESGNGDKTHEEAMLEASREELKEQVPKALQNSKKVRRGIYFFVDMYIFEPICTGLRFLHLVIIFVPVIATLPMIWFGKRQADRDYERSGTLWWYGFLVRSMERAGAAFIKVRWHRVHMNRS